MNFKEFSNERLQNMLKQGEYFQDEKVDAAIEELKKRGLLTALQADKHHAEILIRKEQLSEKNQEGIRLAQQGIHSEKPDFWKPRYTTYVIILLVLALVWFYLKTGVIAWYVPAIGTGALVGRRAIFKKRIK